MVIGIRRGNRLGIEIKSRARLGMSKQALNCLYVFAIVDKKGREAVTEVAEAESLTRLEPDANLNGSGPILSAAIMLALRGVLPFIFVEAKIQSFGFA